MSSLFNQIEEQARSLSAEDPARLSQNMLESLQTSIKGVETAWSEEIAERIAEFGKGDISAYTTEQVFAEARHLLR